MTPQAMRLILLRLANEMGSAAVSLCKLELQQGKKYGPSWELVKDSEKVRKWADEMKMGEGT